MPALGMAIACITLVIALGPSYSPAASGSTVVTATIPSATYLSIDPLDAGTPGDCMTGTSGSTSLGTVLPGASVVGSRDCSVVFGSSNDTSMLRLFQTDLGGQAMGAGTVGASIVGYWPLNGTLADVSATANPLAFDTAPNDPAFTASGPGLGQAIAFDADDRASVAANAAYSLTAFTVDFWFRTTDTGATLVTRGDAACGDFAGTCAFEFWLDGAGQLEAQIETSSGFYALQYATAVNDGGWHHAALTVDDATKDAIYYLDGVQRDTDGSWSSGNIDSGLAGLRLGLDNGGYGQQYVGDIDELRLQSGVRTPAELGSYYEGAVNDFSSGVNDWSTGTNMFGACLRAVSGGATTDGTSWSADGDGDCADGNADPWRAVSATAAGGKVAFTNVGGTNAARADIRFGFRAGVAQPVGSYQADLTFEVVAPAT